MKEGAYEDEADPQDVLGDEAIGRTKAEAIMGSIIEESTGHPNSSVDAWSCSNTCSWCT